MPFFHATFADRLPSILRHGLRAGHEKNWPGIEDGVYLASHAEVAIWIMLERYLRFGDPTSVPREELARLRVIVVDDTRVRPNLLRPDPEFDGDADGVGMIYPGVIDVTGMPILTLDDVLPPTDPTKDRAAEGG
jgi:hypothetical protein